MYAIDFISEFSVNQIPEPDTTLEALLRQTEEHDTTLTLTTSRRGLVNQVNPEAVAETLDVTANHPRLLAVGTLDPRYFLNWQDDLQACVDGGCVAIRFAPGPQKWSPDTLVFEQMVEAVGAAGLPAIVDFKGAADALPWIRKVGEACNRYGTNVVMNEVNYAFAGELITVMQAYPNVYAAIRWLCLADGLEVMVEAGVGERLLYGSNSPKYSIRSLRNQIFMAKISEEQKQGILGANALRLLNMDIEDLPVEPLMIKAEADLPEEPIIDIHAHVSGFHVPEPFNTRTETNVSEMTERCNIQYTFVSSYNAINYDMKEGTRIRRPSWTAIPTCAAISLATRATSQVRSSRWSGISRTPALSVSSSTARSAATWRRNGCRTCWMRSLVSGARPRSTWMRAARPTPAYEWPLRGIPTW